MQSDLRGVTLGIKHMKSSKINSDDSRNSACPPALPRGASLSGLSPRGLYAWGTVRGPAPRALLAQGRERPRGPGPLRVGELSPNVSKLFSRKTALESGLRVAVRVQGFLGAQARGLSALRCWRVTPTRLRGLGAAPSR